MEIYARQGDLVIERLVKPTEGEFENAVDAVLAGSTSGATHTLLGRCRLRREERRILVHVDTDTQIVHDGRHLPTKILAGDYEIRQLREDGDRAVED